MKIQHSSKKLYLLLVLFFIAYNSDALTGHGRNPVRKKTLPVIINGRLDNFESVDSIVLKLHYPVYFQARNYIDAVNYTSKLKQGYFSFKFPSANHPRYISISYKRNNKTQFMGTYLIEKGDSIYITSKEFQLEFSGIGSDKFKCQYEIKKMKEKKSSAPLVNLTRLQDYYTFLTNTQLSTDSSVQKEIDILSKYKSKLSNGAFTILKADCIGEKWENRYYDIGFYMSIMKNDTIRQKQVIRYFIDELKGQKADTANAALVIYSKNFSDFLFEKEKISLLMKINEFKPWKTGLNATQFINVLNDNYSGILKEKLITTCFIKGIVPGNDSIKFKSLSVIKHPDFIKVLNLLQGSARGKPAYNFSLQDSTGRQVMLTEFKNKVVVLEYWISGCRACIALGKSVKPVYDLFRNNDSVAFITISIDEEKKVWLKSLKSNIYTSSGMINLYTGGEGLKHPSIKFYGFQGVPQLIIIDKSGKIFDSTPTRPSNPGSTLKFIDIIKEALKNNSTPHSFISVANK